MSLIPFPYNLIAGGVGLVLAAGGAFLFVENDLHARAEAAKVPGLEATIKSDNARADVLAKQNIANNARANEAERLFSQWQAANRQTITDLRNGLKHAAVNTNPVCLPSNAERKLFNDAIAKAIGAGSVGSSSELPKTPSGISPSDKPADVRPWYDLGRLFNSAP